MIKIDSAQLLSVIHEAGNVPLAYEDRNEALTRITQLARQVLNSQVCTLVLVDVRNKTLTHTACAGFDERFERKMAGTVITIGSSSKGYFLDDELLSRGEGGARYNLQVDGQGVVNPSVARRYKFNALLSYALKSQEDGLIGYLTHFSAANTPFDEEEKRLIEIFGRQALITIERFDNLRALDHSLRVLNELSQSRVSDTPNDFFNQVSIKGAELLGVNACIVWKVDKRANRLGIIGATPNVDDEYRKFELDLDAPGIKKHLLSRKPGYLEDARTPSPGYFSHPQEAAKRGWVSLLSAPMWSGESELVGMIDVFTDSVRHFKRWEQDFLAAFAHQAALFIVEKRKEIVISGIQSAYNRSTNNANAPSGNQLAEVASLIVEESAKALGANTCFLHLLNRPTNILELTGWYAPEKTPPQDLEKIKLGEGLIGTVAKTGQPHICAETHNHEADCAALAEKTNALSYLSVPIKWGDTVIGTIGAGADKIQAFGKIQLELLEDILESMQGAIGRSNFGDNLLSLARASHEAKTLDELCPQLAGFTRDLINEAVCVVWLIDKNRDGFAVAALVGPEDQVSRKPEMFISSGAPGLETFLKRTSPKFLWDASKRTDHPYHALVKELEWKSMLATPLVMKERVIGILEVYSYKETRDFKGWPIKLFESWATQVSIAIGNTMAKERLEILGELTRQMADTNKIDRLLDLALEGSLKLVRSKRGWISRLDPLTGTLEIINHRGNPETSEPLKPGEGITGKALEEQAAILACDVREWPSYIAYWKDTLSEVAVPILLKSAEVRILKEPSYNSKRIGVLNVESPMLSAFSEEDKESLIALGQMTAIMIERLELDRKIKDLTDVETQIAGMRGYDETMQRIMRGIKKTLGYDYVNISLVVPENDSIQTEYIFGIEADKVEEFKKLAVHSLNSNDIQASIVKSRDIEVPDALDPRFDPNIYSKFGHKDFVRVFLPMILPADDRVIGTVEAGYKRTKYREHIYEQDVQILQGFLTYAVQALEIRNKSLMETICHDLRNSMVGVKSNASFLKRHFKKLDVHKIGRKLQDLHLEAVTLLDQVDEVEYVLGGPPPVSEREFTVVMTDVVKKTAYQLTPMLEDRGFKQADIEIKPEDLRRIRVYIDQGKLNQVVINLLINSIKYSENEPDDFKIRISVDQTINDYIIKFKDWGIGIRKGLEARIFERGYRAPEAVHKDVAGSGLGLTRARKIMKDLKGDLLLVNRYKPTEFHILLPKNLKEKPNDTVH